MGVDSSKLPVANVREVAKAAAARMVAKVIEMKTPSETTGAMQYTHVFQNKPLGIRLHSAINISSEGGVSVSDVKIQGLPVEIEAS